MFEENVNIPLTDVITVLDDMQLVRDEPSVQPCYEVNPELWRLFCQMSNREFAPNYVWSEMDVILWIDEKTMKASNKKRIDKLSKMIDRMEISRSRAAEIIGVQDRTIYRWLSGERQIPVFVFNLLHYADLLRKHRIQFAPPDDLP